MRWKLLLIAAFLSCIATIARDAHGQASRTQRMDVSLTEIERLLTNIERSRRISDEGALIDSLLDNYADAAWGSFDQAMREATRYNDSKGRQGSLNALTNFERAGTANLPRLQGLGGRMMAIARPLREGDIMVD